MKIFFWISIGELQNPDSIFPAPMNQEFVDDLLRNYTPEQYPTLIKEQNFSLETIQQLKEHSAQFRFSDPGETMRIAQVAHDLSMHMSAEAQALGQWTLGNARTHAGDFRQADQLFQSARQAYLSVDNFLDAARMGLGHVVVLGYIGETDRALHLAQEVEPILEESSRENAEDLERLGKLLMNLGNVNELLGQYEEALEIYQRQVPIAEDLGNHLLLAQAKHNQAYALAQLNEFEEARLLYAEAEKMFTKEGASVQLITLYINQVTLYVRLGQHDIAREIHRNAYSQLSESAQQDWQIHQLPLLRGLIELQDGKDIDEFHISSLRNAQAAFAEIGSAMLEGIAWEILGRCYLQRRELALAKKAFTELGSLATYSGDPALQFHALAGLARTSIAQGHPQIAIDQFEGAIRQIETIRGDLNVETFRSGFLTDKLFAYQELAALHLQHDDIDSAFQTIERAKARSITEKLAVRVETDMRHLTQSSDVEVQKLGAQLEKALEELDKLYPQLRLQSMTQDPKLSDTVTSIGNLEAEAREISRKIQRTVPRFSSLLLGETASIGDLTNVLDDGVFLQYYAIYDDIWVLVIDQNGLSVCRKLSAVSAVEDAHKAFSASVERLWELISKLGVDKTLRYLPQLISDSQKHLSHLYELLIYPIAEFTSQYTHLTIAPDGLLYYIPFHALFDGKTYLAEDHIIRTIPNATSLLFCSQPYEDTSEGSLLIGYDSDERLEKTTKEILSVSESLKSNGQAQVNAVTHAEATTTYFLTNAASQRHIHLAAHAEFRADVPMLSSILFADRRLTLAEIAQLKLNAELVVLSGCETGQGRLYGSDSVSLASGFLGAGAKSLLVSLWRIEDSATATFMERFYQSYLSGQPVSVALADAQRWLLERGRESSGQDALYAHPAYWAPFLLMGSE